MTSRQKRKLFFTSLLLFIIFCFDRCERINELQKLEAQITEARVRAEKFEVTINEQGQQIAVQEQIILSKNQALELGMQKMKGLTNYKNQVVIKTQTKYDTIFSPYDIDSTETLQGQVTFTYSEPWISFDGKLLDSGVAITDLSIKNDYVLTIADKKLGFFSKPLPVVTLLNKNPHTNTQAMTNMTIKQEQPFYKRPWVWFTFGITSGIIISRI